MGAREYEGNSRKEKPWNCRFCVLSVVCTRTGLNPELRMIDKFSTCSDRSGVRTCEIGSPIEPQLRENKTETI